MRINNVILLLAMMYSISCAASTNTDDIMRIMDDLNSQDAVLLQLHTCGDVNREVYSVSKHQVERSPEWLQKTDPPLSLLDAIDHARAYLRKEHNSYKSFLLTSINMHVISSEEFPNRWYYALDFQAKYPVEGGWGSESLQVFLLMDRTIVKPTVYKRQAPGW